ncbi:threonine ammonia-lyase [Pseudogracilibacillus sp. ICA-222130]|uniref:threonine ammonia-lyase n=1 Tax=Pseudogracilibacillus sp. ICA-222130 TaxID=3134655 RepID=UPI0030C2A075
MELHDQTSLSLQHVLQAQHRMRPFVQQTPLISSGKLNNMYEASIYLKLENLHETGAFKIRGAANKLLSLTTTEKLNGVTTFSTGNHGVAVAYMAQKLGIEATICISNRVPDAKVKRLEAYGAKIIKVGESQDDAAQYCYRLQEEGKTLIEPFDDITVIAGQGTIGLEILDDLPNIDMVIIPTSGGGLFAGIAYVLKSYHKDIEVVGVSMERSAVMYESVRANKPVILKEYDTLADSLLGGIGEYNRYTFSAVKKYIDEFVLVSEEEIKEAMKYMLEEHKQLIEGAAATSIAAILSEKVHVQHKNVAAIITGNNVNISVLRTIL